MTNKKRKHILNDNYFDKINSHRVAYFFGLLYSDGSVSPHQNKISISLKAEDSYLIDEFKKEIQSDAPIGVYVNPDKSVRYSLQLYSEKMCNDLVKHGCIPQKSLTKTFPEIQEKYLFSFLRGYFDGNGCISFYKVKEGTYRNFQISSSIPFNTMLMGLLESKYGIKAHLNIKKGTHCDLRIRRKESIIFLRDKMYKDDTVSMKRKKEKLYS